MEKQFVPYELAVILKELGFDEPCIAYYVGGEDRFIYDIYTVNNFSGRNILIGKSIATPLWQQVFDWFREKGYGAFVETWTNGGVKKFRGRNNYTPLFITDVFDTYEEARYACLEKLIEIIENK